MVDLVSDPKAVTTGWLTEVLRFAGFDGTVTGFTALSIGTGQVGENVRFSLTGTGELPDTIVGKFASPDPISRQTGIDQLNYKREVYFYKHLQNNVDIQTPTIFFTEIDDETHDFVIMMEDLAPGTQGDQLNGCDAQTAALALDQLARLHGPGWAHEPLKIDALTAANTENDGTLLKAFYEGTAPGFLARYEALLNDDEREMVQLVGANLIDYQTRYTGDLTLIHYDYRLDNMMFGGSYPVTIVDWQSVTLGCAMNDAAYFLGTSMPEAARLEHENDLMQRYHASLSAYNVNFSWDDCWHYYRHYAPAGLIMAVIASMIVGETERGNEMFMAMAKRSAKMCRDLDSIQVIRGNV